MILVLIKVGIKAKKPTVVRVGGQYRLYSKASIRLSVTEKKRFPRVTAVPYTP